MKSAPKAPTPIDPTKVSYAQTTSNIDTALAQQQLNQQNTNNPFSSTAYNQTGTKMVNGQAVPITSQTTTLTPALQSLLNSYMGNANTSAGNATPNPSLLNQNTADALYNQATSRLDPQYAQAQRQFDASMAEKGIPIGSEAYDHAKQNFDLAKNDAYTSAQNAATQYATQDASTLFNNQLQAQQQPLSLLTQLMGGVQGSSAGAPTQTGVSPTDVTGAYENYQNQLETNYQNQLQAANSANGGTAGLIGSVVSAAAMAF